MAANVLVVASQTAGSQHLLDALIHRAERSPIKVTLVMPAQGPGLSGREAMKEPLEAALAAMRERGLEAEGSIGDNNPMDAVAEFFDPSRHDEVIVCTLPGRSSKWLQHDLPPRAPPPPPRPPLPGPGGHARRPRRPAPGPGYEPGTGTRARADGAALRAFV